MAQFLSIHPDNPELRLVRKAVEVLKQGGVIIYPTDSAYALGCRMGDKKALQAITRIRKLDSKHNFTLMCRDLSEISTYAKVDNVVYRLLKAHTPDAYTFILRASSEVPRLSMNPKRKTIGIRVPDHSLVSSLLAEMNEPILSSSLILPDADEAINDINDIRDELGHAVELIIDSGYCNSEPTTVIDLVDGTPIILRHGKADTTPFE